MTAWVIDIFAIAIILFGVARGRKKGLVKSLQRIASWIITILLVFLLSDTAVNIMSQTPVADKVYDSVHSQVSEKAAGLDLSALDNADNANEFISRATGMPQVLVPHVFGNIKTEEIKNSVNESVENAAASIAKTVSELLIKIIANLLLFILIKIAITIFFSVLNGVTSLPVLKGINGFLGMLFGFVNIMFIIYLVCALLYIILPVNSGIYSAINGTYLVRYLYNHNILLQLFMKM